MAAQLFQSSTLSRTFFQDKDIYLDSDVLSLIFNEGSEVSTKFLEIVSSGNLIIHPLVRFEFLRDIFIPQHRKIKEDIISSSLFIVDAWHTEIFQKDQEIAMDLSQIYSHTARAVKKKVGTWSMIDLLLAARIARASSMGRLLVTANRRDYPSCVFDQIGTLVVSKDDDSSTVFSVLSYNETNFKACKQKINALAKKQDDDNGAGTSNKDMPSVYLMHGEIES